MDSQIFTYNGSNITFALGNGDVMVNATQMAKPFGKRPNDYLNLPSTNELIKAITRKPGKSDNQTVKTNTRKSGIADNQAVKAIVGKSHFDENQIVRSKRGGNNPGTWLHEDLALDFAKWLSVDFRLWCNDRIKELLRHGITGTDQKLEEIANNPDLLIELATNLKKERAEKNRLQEQYRLQSQELKETAPKVEYYQEVLQSDSLIPVTIIAKELGIGAPTLNRKLNKLGVQYRQSGTWILYSKYQNKGYTKTKTHTYLDRYGKSKTSIQTVWTEKGRKFIHQIINQNNKK